MNTKKQKYKEFLKTDFWKQLTNKKKSLINKCERCNNTEGLQCHHMFYRNNWYNTKIEDLEVLCIDCHYKTHEKSKSKYTIKRKRKKITKSLPKDINKTLRNFKPLEYKE